MYSVNFYVVVMFYKTVTAPDTREKVLGEAK